MGAFSKMFFSEKSIADFCVGSSGEDSNIFGQRPMHVERYFRNRPTFDVFSYSFV